MSIGRKHNFTIARLYFERAILTLLLELIRHLRDGILRFFRAPKNSELLRDYAGGRGVLPELSSVLRATLGVVVTRVSNPAPTFSKSYRAFN